MQNWKNAKLRQLAHAIMSFDTEKEVVHFLRDLCTLEELNELSSRWEVVLLLDKGVPYREIAQKTGISTTTITRIAFWLNNGEGGYKTALIKRKEQKP